MLYYYYIIIITFDQVRIVIPSNGLTCGLNVKPLSKIVQ